MKGLFSADPGIEITRRVGEKGTTIFVINHKPEDAQVDFGKAELTNRITDEYVSGKQTIRGRDVWILRLDKDGCELP